MAHIAGIVGGLNADSHNKLLLAAFFEQLPKGVTSEELDISALPFFNPSDRTTPVAAVADFKKSLESADGVVIVTPEYNRSIPAPLKNAIDWTSYPTSTNSWFNKPVFVMGASTGALGAALAQAHLKQILLYLNARILGYPELCIGFVQDRVDSQGVITDLTTATLVMNAATSFAEFAGTVKAKVSTP